MVSAEATLIVLRESLEAFLILSILTGLVMKLGKPEARKPLLLGAAAALAASIAVGVVIHATIRDWFEASGSAEAFEGVASLLAVLILTYMIVWMYQHTISMVPALRTRVAHALDARKPAVLFSLAFVVVAREGLETVLFFATIASRTPAIDLVVATLLGIAVSAIVAYLLFSGIVRLDLQRFFAATGVLLILFAGGMLMYGVHELSEVGAVPETPHAWNTEWLLDQHSAAGSIAKAVFGYRESPTVIEAAAYFLYVLGFGLWYLRGIRLVQASGKDALFRGA